MSSTRRIRLGGKNRKGLRKSIKSRLLGREITRWGGENAYRATEGANKRKFKRTHRGHIGDENGLTVLKPNEGEVFENKKRARCAARYGRKNTTMQSQQANQKKQGESFDEAGKESSS